MKEGGDRVVGAALSRGLWLNSFLTQVTFGSLPDVRRLDAKWSSSPSGIASFSRPTAFSSRQDRHLFIRTRSAVVWFSALEIDVKDLRLLGSNSNLVAQKVFLLAEHGFHNQRDPCCRHLHIHARVSCKPSLSQKSRQVAFVTRWPDQEWASSLAMSATRLVTRKNGCVATSPGFSRPPNGKLAAGEIVVRPQR